MQHSLRLISLSNYVFVLEISQISGIVQNASVLIMLVKRIVAVVGEKRREREKGKERRRGSGAEKLLAVRSAFIKRKYLVMARCGAKLRPRNSQGKRSLCL